MNTSLSLALLLLLFFGMPALSQTVRKTHTPKPEVQTAQTLPFADARRMTLIVQTKFPPVSRGSAVWIGKSGYLATCYHVVKDVQVPLVVSTPHDPLFATAGNFNIVVTGAQTDRPDVTVVAKDEVADIAILKASEPPGQRESQLVAGANVNETFWTSKGATLATEDPKPGETVLLAGYPLDQTTLILQTGIATGFGDFPQPGTEPNRPSLNGRRIMLSLVSNPGNSGGPVLDVTGKVIGLLEGNLLSPIHDKRGPLVCFRPQLDAAGNPLLDVNGNPNADLSKPTWCTENSGISLAVPAQFIIDLAKKNNIDLR